MEARAQQLREAWRRKDREDSLGKIRLGCVVGMILVPSFAVLDFIVYDERHWPGLAWHFLLVRLACSGLIGAFMAVLLATDFGRRSYRTLGVTLVLLPGAAIAYMVFRTEGPASPYYAGLNLVLLVVGFVLRWTFRESLIAVFLVGLEYLAACWGNLWLGKAPEGFLGAFAGNLYFLGATGIIMVVGNHFFTKARYREFELAFDLNANRQALEEQKVMLERSNLELEESKRQLEAGNEKLRELDRLKSQFFANISHELRTPLTLLLAPLEMLMQRFGADPETRGVFQTMHSNGMRLLKLINDLLSLVRLESGRLEIKPEPLHVGDFIKAVASAAQQVADDKRLALETWVDPALGYILADRDKLEKVVLNLVFNALKFTPAQGRVQVRAERSGEQFVLTVADTGMGISEKNLPFIFDRFWQADGSAKRKYQGVGIGLALVKELIEAQGGQVGARSQEGQGATFTVRLPYEPAEPPPAPEPDCGPDAAHDSGTVSSEEWLSNLYRRAELFPSVAPVHQSLRPAEFSRDPARATVLVADDEPDMLRFVKSQLAEEYNVIEAIDGQQAADKALQFLPDLILVDMMMPEKDGLQVCREVRDHTATKNIPVVLLTARADDETKLACLAAGASDFMTKPFSTTEVKVRVRNLIELYTYQRRLARQNQTLETTIEQLKETELQLVQSEKMASLGTMSAGIIHEIGNPINALTSGLYALRKKSAFFAPERQGEYNEIVGELEERTRWVKDIVSRMRLYSHPDARAREQVEISDLVDSALLFTSHEWKESGARLERRLTPQQTIWANKNMLIQVLLNLLQNSLFALQQKTFPPGETPTVWIESRVEHHKSILVVRDNGAGIAPQHLDKIFDPFFTTKEIGKGMGLGLSICARMVRDFEGQITPRSEPGQFCEFTLEFPLKGMSEMTVNN